MNEGSGYPDIQNARLDGTPISPLARATSDHFSTPSIFHVNYELSAPKLIASNCTLNCSKVLDDARRFYRLDRYSFGRPYKYVMRFWEVQFLHRLALARFCLFACCFAVLRFAFHFSHF